MYKYVCMITYTYIHILYTYTESPSEDATRVRWKENDSP